MSTTAVPAGSFESSSVPSNRLAMWWFLASEVTIFGGIIAAFILFRARHPEFAESAHHTMTSIGFVNTLVLLTSSLTVVLAHREAHCGKISSARNFLGITMLLGLLFLGFKGFEYTHEIQAGFFPNTNLFWNFYFFMTGLHGLHVLIGMAVMLGFWLKPEKNAHRFEFVGLYWHLVDIVWIFLFPLLYLGG